MKTYQTIELESKDNIASIWLNRPDIRNAFNETMIAELLDCFESLNDLPDVRLIILRGRGKAFCAGADLNWMRSVANYSFEENFRESYQLAKCFYTIYTCKKPSIAVVHGASIGGANGLLAACDFAICEKETSFSLSEVKIGVVPACISPYVIKRVGEYYARELMLTGLRFNGEYAEKTGLVNKSLKEDEIETHLSGMISLLMTGGPKAIEQCKKLIYAITNRLNLHEALDYTANLISEMRASEEAQEGMAAFLEKRKPAWVKE